MTKLVSMENIFDQNTNLAKKYVRRKFDLDSKIAEKYKINFNIIKKLLFFKSCFFLQCFIFMH